MSMNGHALIIGVSQYLDVDINERSTGLDDAVREHHVLGGHYAVIEILNAWPLWIVECASDMTAARVRGFGDPCWLPCASRREHGGSRGAQAASPAPAFVLQLGMRLSSVPRIHLPLERPQPFDELAKRPGELRDVAPIEPFDARVGVFWARIGQVEVPDLSAMGPSQR